MATHSEIVVKLNTEAVDALEAQVDGILERLAGITGASLADCIARPGDVVVVSAEMPPEAIRHATEKWRERFPDIGLAVVPPGAVVERGGA